MSLKDLFGKTSEKIISNKQLDQLSAEAESKYYLEETSKERQRYLPAVDFTRPANFSRYGSAEKYYTDAIKNIYQRYPYDGSKKEKIEWRNNSSQLDLYIFDKVYPKATGYVNLGFGTISNTVISGTTYRSSSLSQYIDFLGGPNAGEDNSFDAGNIYDTTKNRESNLAFSETGNTVEFWFKDSAASGSAESDYQFCLFDLWNGNTTLTGSQRLTIEKRNSNPAYFGVSYRNGNTGGLYTDSIILDDYIINDMSNWHHYAFVFKNNIDDSTILDVELYVDGNVVSKKALNYTGISTIFANIDLKGRIGAYLADPNDPNSNTTAWSGLGNAYGSFDEFRFWKAARTPQQIHRNWNTQIGGGTNTDDANTDLGVYYKFNEGIVDATTINSLDTMCLDYSGRITNGTIVNYNTNVRSTGSAIDIYNNSEIEAKDPIIYSSNYLVANVLEEYAASGSLYDNNNNSNIYKSIPSWIVDETEEKNLPDLSNLVQIISSYFDTLHVQIENLPKIKDIKYLQEDNKPYPFINKILGSYGFENLEIFNNATFLEEILSKNEEYEFEKKLDEIKNIIYQNIYNNLTYIYKSKGTEKAFRNLIRCFGVDDELIKVNLYANNAEFEISDKYNYTTAIKKYINLNNTSSYSSTVYQLPISGDNKTRGYLSASTKLNDFGEKIIYNIPLTHEAEILFPKNISYEFANFNIPDFTKISLFGLHEAPYGDTSLNVGSDNFNYQVYAIKRNVGSKDVYFNISGSIGGYGFNLTSSYYNEVYDNQKWNLAVRFSPLKDSYTTNGSNITDYLIELIGNNYLLDEKLNESFKVSSVIPQANAKIGLESNKRIYAGAHYSNFTSSLTEKSDVKISSVRYWYDYLKDSELKSHSIDANSFGRENINWNPKYISSSAEYNSSNSKIYAISKADTLALNWDFSLVSSSDNNGKFIVADTSSGSVQNYVENVYNWFGVMAGYQHTAIGYAFAANDANVTSPEYIYSGKIENFEVLHGSDLISTPVTDDLVRSKKNRAITYYIAFEKSMAQIINREILNWFSTINDFNNLIGAPIERYNKDYKSLNHLKKLFFEKVNNTPDFERFLEFYKWLDSSISMMITQIAPASSNMSTKVRNLVESHMLERNKYENKLPTLEFKKIDNMKVINGSTTIVDPYASSFAPYNPTGSLWLQKRANRTESPVNTPGEPQNDTDREIIRQVVYSNNLNDAPVLYDYNTRTPYSGKKDTIRFFSKIYSLTAEKVINPESVIKAVSLNSSQLTTIKKFNNTLENQDSIFNASSSGYGSYINSYEYFQAVGRSTNNKSFIDLQGNVSGSNSNSGLGFTDRTLPNRSTNKQVFVQRFAAPGGAEVSSRGATDQESEEYSTYNSLNYRNYRVRENLRGWLAETASIDTNNPSYHKVKSNISRYPGNSAGTITNTQNDNEFVSRAIPRSDNQYSWFTSSISSSSGFSAIASQYDNLYNTSSYILLSGSLSGSRIIDYVGIYLSGSLIFNTSSNLLSSSVAVSDLNSYLLNLNGPYNSPSWKQIRNSFKKISVLSRKNNYILTKPKPISKTKIENGLIVQYYDLKPAIEEATSSFKEPPVTYNKPMTLRVNVTGSPQTVIITAPYDNNKEYFANNDLMNAVDVTIKKDPQLHDVILDIDKNNKFSPKPEYVGATYSTQIYPAKQYVGLKEIRLKPDYEETLGTGSNGYDRNIATIRSFWRDSVFDRARTNAYSSSIGTGSINSLSYPQISASYSADPLYNQQGPIINLALKYRYTPGIILSCSFDSTKNYDSIYCMDSYESSSYTAVSTSIGGVVIKYNISQSYYGDLYGYNEIENLLFLAKTEEINFPSTSEMPPEYVLGIYDQEYAFNKKFDFKYFIRPKPSLGTKIAYPSYAFSNVSNAVINKGLVYKTDIISGKKPFYSSYEEFSEDIKPLSKNKSIIPEYNISNFLDYYIIDKQGDFTSYITGNYLSLYGNNQEFNNIIIDTSYNKTNILNQFIFDDFKKNVLNNENLATKKLTINVDAIKKLLPYKGFYPNERSSQLVDLFQKSFFGLSIDQITGSYPSTEQVGGTPLNRQIQTVLQPLFAPGILFNTIKSCLAVDWPIFYENLNVGPSYGENYSAFPTLNPSATPYFYTSASALNTTGESILNITSTIFTIGCMPNGRAPFESLLDFNLAFTGSLEDKYLFYVDPTRQGFEYFTGSYTNPFGNVLPRAGNTVTGISYPNYQLASTVRKNRTISYLDNRYQMAMNNFLSEIPNFFLNNRGLTSFTSKQEKDFDIFEKDKPYELYVELKKDIGLETVLDYGLNNIKTAPSTLGPYPIAPGKRMSLIPAASTFGFPFMPHTKVTSSQAVSSGNYLYNTPAYAPYTPPYYYGPRILKMTFIPSETRRYTIKEIINSVTSSEYNTDINKYFDDVYRAYGAYGNDVSYTSSVAVKAAMPLSASINLFQISKEKLVDYDQQGSPVSIKDAIDTNLDKWVIQTKFETPVLNFNTNENILYSTASYVASINNNFVSEHATVGMWTGYGTSSIDKNIKLKVYSPNNNLTKSLAEAVGFLSEEKNIGVLSSEKEISEAIILIPYTNIPKNMDILTKILGENGVFDNKQKNTQGPFYFKVKEKIIDDLLKLNFKTATKQIIQKRIENLFSGNGDAFIDNIKNEIKSDVVTSQTVGTTTTTTTSTTITNIIKPKAESSIIKTIKAMLEYNIPPHLDWVSNKNVEPFVMYMIEVKHKLNKQDLTDIWQGLMPEISRNAELDTSSLTHELNMYEFFHGEKIPKDIKWKVFKAKKKANISYYDLTADSSDDNRFKFEFKTGFKRPEYSYNWPYDFFSLVELVNISVDLDIQEEKKQTE